MKEPMSTPIHAKSLMERSESFEEKLHEVEKQNLAKGSFKTYTNDLCSSVDLFINEYSDRIELVSVDSHTGKISLIQKLS
jgi:hypothetical protein